jgi:hypothetical protein
MDDVFDSYCERIYVVHRGTDVTVHDFATQEHVPQSKSSFVIPQYRSWSGYFISQCLFLGKEAFLAVEFFSENECMSKGVSGRVRAWLRASVIDWIKKCVG